MTANEKACIINCGDPRYSPDQHGNPGKFEAIYAKIIAHFHLLPPYRLTDFGASLALNDTDKRKHWEKSLGFVHKHGAETFFIIDHLDVCAAFVDAYGSAENVEQEIQQHEEELTKAKKTLLSIIPGASVITILHDYDDFRIIS